MLLYIMLISFAIFFSEKLACIIATLKFEKKKNKVHVYITRVHTTDIRIHTINKRVHTSNIRVTYEYIRVHTSTYECIRVHTSNIRIHTDTQVLNKQVLFGF